MWTLTETPVGTMRLVASDGALTAAEFLEPMPAAGGDPGESTRWERRWAERAAALPGAERADDEPVLAEAVRQLGAYFRRELRVFDLPLAPSGSPFQLLVWEQLRAIGYGELTSYGVIAARLGKTGHAARAVGAANGANPIAVIVPCHRVVGAGGRLVGYAGGLGRKQHLLALENPDSSAVTLW